jgi:hypothetical protein
VTYRQLKNTQKGEPPATILAVKQALRWLLPAVAIVALAFFAIRHHYVINSGELESAIRKNLPLGSSKAQVIEFVRLRHPVFCDDLGAFVKTRISGLADNMIYGKDIVLTFQFDGNGKLLSYSKQETLTFF